jgi:hypothetical protein
MSKGSGRRPGENYADNWDKIFSKKPVVKESLVQPERPQNCGSGFCSCIECVMEPEQEPVKDWVASHDEICALLRQAHDALALTSYPLKRKWVGLTGEEKALVASVSFDAHDAVHRTNAKLKELNT